MSNSWRDVERGQRPNHASADSQRRLTFDANDVGATDAADERRSAVEVDAEDRRRFDDDTFIDDACPGDESVGRAVDARANGQRTRLKRHNRDVDHPEGVRLNNNIDFSG